MALATLFNNKKILKFLLSLFIVVIFFACLISILSSDFKIVVGIMHYLICLAVIICCYIATCIILNAYGDKLDKILKYKKNEEKLNDLVKKDSLTNLYNNRTIKAQIKLNLIENNKDMMLSMLDIDDFKKINDTYGHTFGDDVISYLASSLKKISSDDIICGRYGGDEFLIVSTNYMLKEMREIIKKIINDFETHYQEEKITISCGIAKLSEDIKDEIDFINKADLALYYIKNNGKNDIYEKD